MMGGQARVTAATVTSVSFQIYSKGGRKDTRGWKPQVLLQVTLGAFRVPKVSKACVPEKTETVPWAFQQAEVEQGQRK